MTREQKIAAFTMRMDGKTYREIGHRFGLSAQGAWVALRDTLGVRETDANARTLEKVMKRYPGIGSYMRRNNMKLSGLAALCGLAPSSVRAALIDGHDPAKYTIDKILKGTGMTYEEAFGNADGSGSEDESGNDGF